MSGTDFTGNLPDDDNYDEVYETHRSALWDMLMDYGEKHDLADGFLADIVSDMGLSLRMVAYAAETEKPSVGGLRLDLDRYVREIGEFVRDAKKGAAEFIAETKAARAEEEAEEAQKAEPAEVPEPEKQDAPESAAALAPGRSFPRRR